MLNLGPYAKGIFAALMAALVTIQGVLSGPNGDMTDREWINVALAAVTALGVYLFPNAAQSDPPAGGVHRRVTDEGESFSGVAWTVLAVLGCVALVIWIAHAL